MMMELKLYSLHMYLKGLCPAFLIVKHYIQLWYIRKLQLSTFVMMGVTLNSMLWDDGKWRRYVVYHTFKLRRHDDGRGGYILINGVEHYYLKNIRCWLTSCYCQQFQPCRMSIYAWLPFTLLWGRALYSHLCVIVCSSLKRASAPPGLLGTPALLIHCSARSVLGATDPLPNLE